MRSALATTTCAGCGSRITVLVLGDSRDACEVCGRLASHVTSNGWHDETASSDARVADGRRDATHEDD